LTHGIATKSIYKLKISIIKQGYQEMKEGIGQLKQYNG